MLTRVHRWLVTFAYNVSDKFWCLSSICLYLLLFSHFFWGTFTWCSWKFPKLPPNEKENRLNPNPRRRHDGFGWAFLRSHLVIIADCLKLWIYSGEAFFSCFAFDSPSISLTVYLCFLLLVTMRLLKHLEVYVGVWITLLFKILPSQSCKAFLLCYGVCLLKVEVFQQQLSRSI